MGDTRSITSDAVDLVKAGPMALIQPMIISLAVVFGFDFLWSAAILTRVVAAVRQ